MNGKRDLDQSDAELGVLSVEAVLIDIRRIVEGHVKALQRDSGLSPQAIDSAGLQLHGQLVQMLIQY